MSKRILIFLISYRFEIKSNLISAVFAGKLDNLELVKEEFRGIVSSEIDK
ncbi:MAG: hypothetical protein NY202_03105 [Mollicutes bacterium UO1]